MATIGDRFYRERERPIEQVLAWGTMHSADFDEKTIALRIQGNMPQIAAGRYAIVEAEKLRMLVMQANAFRERQSAGKAA